MCDTENPLHSIPEPEAGSEAIILLGCETTDRSLGRIVHSAIHIVDVEEHLQAGQRKHLPYRGIHSEIVFGETVLLCKGSDSADGVPLEQEGQTRRKTLIVVPNVRVENIVGLVRSTT